LKLEKVNNTKNIMIKDLNILEKRLIEIIFFLQD